MAVSLRTPRLVLREWRDADREPFAAMSSDPEIMEMLPPLLDRGASDAWIARMQAHLAEHGFAYRAIELPGEASLIGAIGLSRVRFPAPFTPAVEIGWRLARSYWGQGYALEAARATIDDGFGRLGLHEIVAFTAPANRRSWRLMERLGMTRNPAEDFDFPGFAEGHPLRRAVLYRIRRAGR
ncbi:MAG TPA: GNAT family N-acetyltransferase [Stellaceae bacterium]|jgi:RimJ/RimL family protein N-acetyltransferase|nr:GNAT family N-acetyltransferase [Stellaceae bacterium]